MNESRNRVYSPPTEITAEMKMKGFIPLTFIIVVAVMLFIAQRTEGMIFEPFRIAWYIYNGIVGFIFCVKARWNGEKRIIQSILLFLFRDTGTYHAIDNPTDYRDMGLPRKADGEEW